MLLIRCTVAYWVGEDDEGNRFNYVRGEDGIIAGSFTDFANGNVYQLSTDHDGSPVVKMTPSELFPDEKDAIDEEGMTRARQLRGSGVGIDLNLLPENVTAAGIPSRKLQTTASSTIDVMVVWTKKSECANSGLGAGCSLTTTTKNRMMALIELAVEETNTAYLDSGVKAQLNLVHAYRHPSYVEATTGDVFGTALSQISSTTDGIMDDVHTKRNTYGADVVAMIIDDPSWCGLAYVGPRADLMFSVTKYSCATGYYSFGHEIGHNMGLLHDRGTTNKCTSDLTKYNYGYRDPASQFRSIMAYSCKVGSCDYVSGTNGCNRVQMFSNIEYTYAGKAIGSSIANNARVINENRVAIAGYKSSGVSPPPTGCATGEKLAKVAIKTDNYPGETTWNIKNDATGQVVLSGGPYSTTGSTITIEECLNGNSGYTFTINDSWGDGICCGYGTGDYKLYWDGVLVASGGAFGSTATHTFGGCVDLPGWVDSYGDDCTWYEMNDDPGCPNYVNQAAEWANPITGITHLEACCHCD